MQHNSGSTVQYCQRTQFQILVNLPNGTSRFFWWWWDRSSHHSDLENQWLQVASRLWWRYWQSEWQIIHSTLPFPLHLVYYHYFHSLLPTPINASPTKHLRKRIPNWTWTWIKAVQLDSLTNMLIDWLVFTNCLLITSSLMNPLVQTSNHSPKNSDRDMHASRT